ncbi:MAG TPA: hypothetical protein VFY71_01535 [Planctomycetota bacterium]|nr:hypothetical protein [Planctomycetota bacterium]
MKLSGPGMHRLRCASVALLVVVQACGTREDASPVSSGAAVAPPLDPSPPVSLVEQAPPLMFKPTPSVPRPDWPPKHWRNPNHQQGSGASMPYQAPPVVVTVRGQVLDYDCRGRRAQAVVGSGHSRAHGG